jgi:hypothetical protein
MSLRSSLMKLLGPLPRSGRSASRWAGLGAGLTFASVAAVGYAGCSDPSMVCDENGENCQICDGYGCHPADPKPSGGTGGTGGSVSTANGGSGGTGATGGSGGTGGSPPCDPKQAVCSCDDTNDCADGQICVNGLCVDGGCDFTYECGPGKICFNGLCLEGCNESAPCDAGYICDNGACVLDPANPECSDKAPCANANEVCIEGLCTLPCSTNADCPDGEVCNGETGGCIPDPSPKPTCSDNVMCPGAGQVCADDGYCHYPCSTLNDCKLVDNRFTFCDQGICKTDEEVIPECTLDAPCPAGQDCISGKCI